MNIFEKIKIAGALAVSGTLMIGASSAIAEPKVEVMHMWTGGAAAEALAKMATRFRDQGGEWEDNAIAGHTAKQYAALRARVMSGDAPTAVQLKGKAIAEWAESIGLGDLNYIAGPGNWNEVMAPQLIDIMSFDGKFVAVPVNIHRVNWMFASKKAMDKVGETSMPKTWAEFNAVAEKMAAAGLIPVGHGGQDWQDLTIFETVAVGMSVDFYKKAFVDLDDTALRGPMMIKTLDQVRKMVGWMDSNSPGRSWGETAVMLGKGDAGFQFMGDWWVGNMTSLGHEHGVDYYCDTPPAEDGKLGFTLNSDSFAFFDQTDPDKKAGQKMFAEIAFSKETQKGFNLSKGSIPARNDVDLSDFTPCQQMAQEHLDVASNQGTLVPSIAHSIAQPQAIRSAVMEVVSNFMNSDQGSQDAANQIADAVRSAM